MLDRRITGSDRPCGHLLIIASTWRRRNRLCLTGASEGAPAARAMADVLRQLLDALCLTALTFV